VKLAVARDGITSVRSSDWHDWLAQQAEGGAAAFNVTLTGARTTGLGARTFGTTVRESDGTNRWMRVVADKPQWAGTPAWYGNAEANAISGVPRPHLLDAQEWDVDGGRVRAELMTLAPCSAVSTEMTPPVSPQIGSTWWRTLGHSLGLLATHQTTRVCVDAEYLDHRIYSQLGVRVDFDRVVWNTAHGDLHWANLTAPDCWLLDWESWGTAPAGYDAALLHAISLTQPPLARHIHQLHRHQLDTPTGRIAQLAAATKVLELIERGHHPELEPLARPVRHHAEEILRDLTQAR
jgi:hypothetical protein